MSKLPEYWKDAPKVKGITIDGPDSKDLDDAIWVEVLNEMEYEITVSVTAVSEKIAKGTERDERALDRVETSYGRTKNWPMLPRWIADDKASLLPGERRPVVFTKIVVCKNLIVRRTEIGLGILHSKAKLCHADIPEILINPDHEGNSQIQLLVRIAEGLMERRRAAGAFVFYDLNHGWITTEEGHVKKLKDTTETIGYIVVQELMILANAAVAELCAKHEIPVPFRNHTAKAHAPERQEVMARLSAGVNEPLRGLETLRKQVNMIMNRADYGTELKGHYGLNLPAYVHSTSPIRRYADLVTQRQLIAWIVNPEVPEYPHTREETTHLAKVINSTLWAKREAESEHHKKQATAKAEGAIAGEVNLAVLPAKEFERVTKTIVRGDTFVPELVQAFKDRIEDGTISVIDLYLGIVEAEWTPLQRVVLNHIEENVHLSPSIVSMACSLRGWQEPEYDVSWTGPDHQRYHTVNAFVKYEDFDKLPRMQKHESGPTGAGPVKVAKQRALVRLLASAAGLEAPEWNDKAAPVVGAPVAPQAPAVPEQSDNPIAALQEFAQKRRLDIPTYDIQRVAGQDHIPKFQGTCSFTGRRVVSEEVSTKKEAKKLAAAAMLNEIRRGS